MKDFEDTKAYNEAFERQIADLQAGRLKVDAHTRKSLQNYLQQKQEHRKAEIKEYERDSEARWALFGKKVCRVQRKKKLQPSEFARGTRIRDAYELLQELRQVYEPLQEQFLEALRTHDQTKAELERYDPESASEFDFRDAVARECFWRGRQRVMGSKARVARGNFEYAQQTLRHQYAAYSGLVEALNAIGPLDRPLARHERLEDRAREVGEVARLEFILSAILSPVAKVAQRSAA